MSFTPMAPPHRARPPALPSRTSINITKGIICLYEAGLIPGRVTEWIVRRSADALARHFDWRPAGYGDSNYPLGRSSRPTR